MMQYMTPQALLQRAIRQTGTQKTAEHKMVVEEPSRADNMVAIQGLQLILEGKVHTVPKEVNLLWTDNIAERMQSEEGTMMKLMKSEVAAFKYQVA